MSALQSVPIDVSELAEQPGSSKEILMDVALDGLGTVMGKVVEGALSLDLLLEALVEGVLVSGSISGTYELECSRCVVDYQEPFSVDVSEVYAYREMDQEVEEGFEIIGGLIDLAPMLRDETLLGIPPNPLHDDACKGLCAVCGQDLNEKDCGHAHAATDVRWEPLQRLKELGSDWASN